VLRRIAQIASSRIARRYRLSFSVHYRASARGASFSGRWSASRTAPPIDPGAQSRRATSKALKSQAMMLTISPSHCDAQEHSCASIDTIWTKKISPGKPSGRNIDPDSHLLAGRQHRLRIE